MRIRVQTPTDSFAYAAQQGRNSFTVGKGAGADVRLAGSQTASDVHVRIEHFMGRWSYTDQFSDAGTLLNGQREYSHELKSGDVLTLGDCTLAIVEIAGQHAPPAAPVPEMPLLDVPVVNVVESTAAAKELKVPVAPPAPARDEAPARKFKAPATHVERIAGHALAHFFRETGHDVSHEPTAMHRLTQAAEKAVEELESSPSTPINLPFFAAGKSGPLHLDVKVQRKHLHHDPAYREVVNGAKPSLKPVVVQQQGKPRPGKRIEPGAIVAGIIVAVVGIGVLVSAIAEGSVEDSQRPLITQEVPSVSDAEKRRAAEKVLLANFQLAMADKTKHPIELMSVLENFERAANEAGVSLGSEGRVARRRLEGEIYAEVTRTYNDTIEKEHERRQKNDLSGAMEALDKLEQFLKESTYRDPAAKQLGLANWIKDRRERVIEANRRLAGEKLFAADRALYRNDYAAAAEAIKAQIDALWTPTQKETFGLEAGRYGMQALLQQQGDVPAPSPDYDRTKPRLPAGDLSALVTDGERGARREINSHRLELEKRMREPGFEPEQLRALNRAIQVSGVERGSEVELLIKRPHGDGEVEYTVRARLANLPAAIQLALHERALPETIKDRACLMVFCFDNGLFDDASRMAYAIVRLSPESKPAVDSFLGQKWGKEVPEDGFPIRNERVVKE
ncbi:MAG: Hsp70 family protein [Planctomycetes bacterium]|nr:Hsp70 family protein [Planctomycetota bacterium]MCW8134963.1 Hsp70 family protein [Planctomycetota bacterium]